MHWVWNVWNFGTESALWFQCLKGPSQAQWLHTGGWLIWDLRQLCGGSLEKVSVIRDNLQSFNAAESIHVDA